jgi:hypothetical protein
MCAQYNKLSECWRKQFRQISKSARHTGRESGESGPTVSKSDLPTRAVIGRIVLVSVWQSC